MVLGTQTSKMIPPNIQIQSIRPPTAHGKVNIYRYKALHLSRLYNFKQFQSFQQHLHNHRLLAVGFCIHSLPSGQLAASGSLPLQLASGQF